MWLSFRAEPQNIPSSYFTWCQKTTLLLWLWEFIKVYVFWILYVVFSLCLFIIYVSYLALVFVTDWQYSFMYWHIEVLITLKKICTSPFVLQHVWYVHTGSFAWVASSGHSLCLVVEWYLAHCWNGLLGVDV